VNLLAGRARTRFLHPLTATKLGDAFSFEHSLRFGCLPTVYGTDDPADYLASYVATYLREEVQQEGLTRNLPAFTRFLEPAFFSQAAVLNVAAVARDCAVDRKLAADYFTLLEDLLLAVRIPAFTRRAQRPVVAHPKFFLFDAGVFRAVRPKGPLDAPAEIDGPALETLLLQHLRAHNDYERAGYELHYWRTRTGLEVDFVLYGERGIRCFDVKRGRDVRAADLRGLQAFRADYPMARATVLYGGRTRRHEDGIEIVPFVAGIRGLAEFLA
jgi:predicted AAA+ superfamily ATPase